MAETNDPITLDDEGQGTPTEATLTQTQVNAILAEERRKLEAKFKAKYEAPTKPDNTPTDEVEVLKQGMARIDEELKRERFEKKLLTEGVDPGVASILAATADVNKLNEINTETLPKAVVPNPLDKLPGADKKPQDVTTTDAATLAANREKTLRAFGKR